MTEQNVSTDERVGKRELTSLDQFVQIIEICFIFLVTFSLVALADSTLKEANLYSGLTDYLGERDVGSLSGGNFEQIVRVTLIFNLLLFVFSLFFGIWMRRTRDNWAWSDFGYTFNTPGYKFIDLVRRGIILGLISILIFYLVLTPISFILNGSTDGYLIFAYANGSEIFNAKALQAEYYFGVVEMGFIWPLSAGFFFFAYAYNSLNSKFPTGVANILATSFYVFYLVFFFIIPGGDKISGLYNLITNPSDFIVPWGMIFVFSIVLYINFSSFAETKSIVLPFIMNFVFNVGLTVIRSANSLLFISEGGTPLMLIIPGIMVVTIIAWYFLRRADFSTLSLGLSHLKNINYKISKLIGFFILFILLSFLLPGIINQFLFSGASLASWVIPTLYAIDFLLIIVLAMIVLTYEPTDVFDVLLISEDGTPVSSHIELFETDEVLISGFFTALGSVNEELSKDSGLKSIKRGEQEILIEKGVYTQLIILADRDQITIRREIQDLHREFEISTTKEEIVKVNQGIPLESADKLVRDIGELNVKFTIPQQTKWISTLSIALGPFMLILIGIL